MKPVLALAAAAGLLAACTGTARSPASTGAARSTSSVTTAPTAASTTAPTPTDTRPPGEFTFAFAGDVNFAERTATRLAADPTTVFGEAQPVISAADLSMVNLETAITTGGTQQNKSFTFRAPPVALTALSAAGVDLATMANNHGADYGASGLTDTLAAIAASKFPVIGIGANATQAFAPYVTTVRGTRIAVIAASQVQDETLAHFSAGASSPGIANAFSPLLIQAVQEAKAAGELVIVYLHWGTEYDTCPNGDQKTLAGQLAAAGATAVVGTHAHVLQAAGWRSDGVYVAYGLGNYLWWRSFGNNQDDNGVLTLTFRGGKVVSDSFAPSRLDSRGVPVPATGTAAAQISAEVTGNRGCANLAGQPPA